MSFVSNFTDPNMLTTEQLAQFKYNYCERIIEDMDMDTLMTLAHDLLMDSYASCTEEEISEEILDLYDEEMLNDMLEEVKNWLTMILFAPEDSSTVYTIDSEGTLFFAPIYNDGTIDFDDFNEVDYVDELDEESLQKVQQKLITMMKSIGEYFQK